MVRKLMVLVLFLFLFALLPVSAFAKANYTKLVTVPTPTPTASATPVGVVSSFELFWPMVAGRTMQSKLYFLKTLKEKVRGIFVFGSAQKADYDIFLGIKRMLESEELMKNNVPDLANKTLDAAVNVLTKASLVLTNAKNSSDIDKTTKDEINIRRDNLKKLVNFLMITYPDYKSRLQSVMDKLNLIVI